MKYQIRITEPASNDIASMASYIKNILQNPQAAEKHLIEIEKAIYELKDMPMKYSRISDKYLAGKNIRCFTVKNYYIFYRIDEHENTVMIIRVLYARSNWKQLLKNKK